MCIVVRKFVGLKSLSAVFAVIAAMTSSAFAAEQSGQSSPVGSPKCTRENTVVARVAAIEQMYVYNRFGAFNPAGMMYALRRDLVASVDDDSSAEQSGESTVKDGEAIPEKAGELDKQLAGNVRLRPGKRPRPIILRVNENDCLRVEFTNLLGPTLDGEEHVTDPENGRKISIDSDEPATRSASIHVNGLELAGSSLPDGTTAPGIDSDGTNVGFNKSSLAAPGETKVYTWIAKKEGGYLLYSMGAGAGGEGDGGQLGLGLFGSVNVEPAKSKWYRSQVTDEQLRAVSTGKAKTGTPIIDYTKKDNNGVPLLDMIMASSDPFAANELVHTDINAVVDVSENGENCTGITGPGSSCGQPFREFSVIFHDEITAVQAFHQLEDEDNPLSALKDGMGINYGAAGLGDMVISNREGKGPAKDCVECKLEEFFLASWAMGDPALVLERGADNEALRALYSDDPSNVHHSYLGDAVRFRNLHAGPKETHVFHLHAHQWTQDWHDPNSVYLDSQTISPGASFTYEVHYGGSGNRNLTPGDSIFHCHLYPHFAQGMWELWRTHDVFEAGTRDRYLPDAEIAGGTPNPAVVPLPHAPLPPMPTSGFRGYPFYIAGVAGHRPPQAPYDINAAAYAGDTSKTLLRHVVLGGERETGVALFGTEPDGAKSDLEKKYFDTTIPEDDPLGQSNRIASQVRGKADNGSLFVLAAKLTKAWIRKLPLDGTYEEQTAMDFHAGVGPGAVSIQKSKYGVPEKGYPSCTSDGTCDKDGKPLLFRVNGYAPKPGAPFADPCPEKFYIGPHDGDPNDVANWTNLAPERKYRATYLQFDMPVNKHGWHDPQARIITLEQDAKATLDHTRPAEPFFFRANSGECIVFEATNLIPSNLNVDDFQVFSPTDTIGQHIHLVKFDVTASDGSGNGWNYEDGTFSPDEMRERIIANNAFKGVAELKPLTHRLFQSGGPLEADPRGVCPDTIPLDPLEAERALEAHPWCGAQSTFQRWWADPLLNQNGEDRTIRTVFTHDHFGPSSHQQHGFYAALVIEPNGSTWKSLAGKTFGGQDASGAQIISRSDGGPTSFAANIIDAKNPQGPATRREYNVAVADFALLYTAKNKPISPPGQLDHDLPQMVFKSSLPRPEGISVSDPGGQLMNYRNEPAPIRLGNENELGRWSLKKFDRNDPSTFAACEAALNALDGGPLKECAADPGPDLDFNIACKANVLAQLCDQSDTANLFSSVAHAGQDSEIRATIRAEEDKASEEGKPVPYNTARIFMDKYLRADCADTADYNCNEPAGLRKDGDPSTYLLSANEGDNVLVRLIQGAQEENHIFFMNGAKWLSVPDSKESGYRAAQHIGISEHFEMNINVEDPNPKVNKDHLYGTTASDNFWDGQWGLMRIVGTDVALASLPRLPNNTDVDQLVNVNQTSCQPSLPRRSFKVEAWRNRDLPFKAKLDYHNKRNIYDQNAIIYVSAGETYTPATPEGGTTPAKEEIVSLANSDLALVKAGEKSPEPLILRARAGECIEVELTNMLGSIKEDLTNPANWSWNMMPPIANGLNFNDVRTSNAIGLHAPLLANTTLLEDGSAVGFNEPSLAYPCNSADPLQECVGLKVPNEEKYPQDNRQTYHWYAGDWKKAPGEGKATLTPIEFGAVGLQNLGDVIKGTSHGSIGALIVEPQDAEWSTDCQILRADPAADEASKKNCLNAAATVTSAGKDFREFVVLFQNDVTLRYKGEALANLRNGDDAEDSGQKAFNYRFEPFWTRLDANPAADPNSMAEYDYTNVLSSKPEFGHGDPSTPLFTATAGTPLRIRLVQPGGHPRNGGFTLSGHDWVNYPWKNASTVQTEDPGPQNRIGSINGMGPGRHENILIQSAGGIEKNAGDFLYRTPLGFAFGGGQWGIMRVFDPAGCKPATAPSTHQVILDANTGRTQVCK